MHQRLLGRTLVRLAATVALLLALPLPVQANVPTVGASRGQFPDVPDQPVPYRWGSSTYPAWLIAAAQDSLDTKYRSWNDNNSHAPRPVYTPGGAAVVYYAAYRDSPCNSLTSLQWLQCASNMGSPSFRIYIRDFDGAPYSDWRWWDKRASCLSTSGTTASGCWYVRRALIHEAGHAIPSFGHDTQTESDTVMRATSPMVGATGGNRFVFQRCDQAALQLLWDVADPARPYGDCFDHIAGHGVRGLVTSVTTNGTSFPGCIATGRLVGGRLAVKIEPLYGRLSNNPLAGRTVWFDRKRRADTTWTTRAESTVATVAENGTDWTRTFAAPGSTGGTWDYRAHFDGDTGLDPSNAATFSITWGVTC
jgi:hypothetical protein